MDCFIGQPYWTALLDSLIEQPYWTALLGSLIPQPYWTTLWDSLIGQAYFIEGTKNMYLHIVDMNLFQLTRFCITWGFPGTKMCVTRGISVHQINWDNTNWYNTLIFVSVTYDYKIIFAVYAMGCLILGSPVYFG